MNMEEENATKIAVMANNIEHIVEDLGYIRKDIREMKDKYVSKDEFEPVKRIVYGVVTLILTAVVVAVIALVVKTNGS